MHGPASEGAERVWLEVVGDSPALDVEGTVGRLAGMDHITFEDDRVVSRPGEGERSRKSCDTAAGDDELHGRKLSSHRDSGKRLSPATDTTRGDRDRTERVSDRTRRETITWARSGQTTA